MRSSDVTAAELVRRAGHPKVVAIGEAGLDFHYDYSPRAVQAKVFRAHIAAARETGLPLVVHSREADAEMGHILEEETGQGPFSAVMHCYTGRRELARGRRGAGRLVLGLRHRHLQERGECT